jgi:outer membrane protein assembly factor BamB
VAAVLALSGCWLQPGADPHRSGHNPRENGLTVDNVATLAQAWSVSLGPDPVPAPVVSGHGVHAVSGRMVVTYRLSNGSQIWSADVLPEYPGVRATAGSVRVRGDALHVPMTTGFRGDQTRVFDAKTGALSESTTPYGLVTVDGDTLIGAEARIIHTDYIQPYLHSTNLNDPSQSWDVMYPGGTFESAVSDDWIISIQGSAVVNAFPRSGPSPDLCEETPEIIRCRPAWSQTLGGVATVPVISDDGQTVFVGDTGGTLSALDIADGSVRWTSNVGSAGQILAAPTVGDGSVFVSTSTGVVFAYDADGCADGDVPPCDARWVTGGADGPVRQQAALAGGVLYVAADDGSIKAFDAMGCESYCNPLWQTFVGRAITGAPAVARGHLVVGTTDGRLIAFAPAG